jgi:hypothetical protein
MLQDHATIVNCQARCSLLGQASRRVTPFLYVVADCWVWNTWCRNNAGWTPSRHNIVSVPRQAHAQALAQGSLRRRWMMHCVIPSGARPAKGLLNGRLDPGHRQLKAAVAGRRWARCLQPLQPGPSCPCRRQCASQGVLVQAPEAGIAAVQVSLPRHINTHTVSHTHACS